MMLAFLFAVGSCLVACAASQNIIYQEGAAGSEAALLSIGAIQQSGVFGDDNELLRRIAYTETRDGTLSSTYRSGYHGGVWAVDEAAFLRTKNTVQYTRLPAKFQQIQLHFGIDWLTVQWRELRKPLYSALAARLVIYIAPRAIPSADDLPAQAQFWVANYNMAGNAAAFVTTSSGLEGSVLESSANEFFLGFSTNYQTTYPGSLQFFVSTPEPSQVSFSITATGFSFTGSATNHSTTIVTLPTSLEVSSNTERNKGIYVKAEGEKKIVVYGISYKVATTDAFLALPCSNLAVDNYEYYGVTYPIINANLMGDILLVGCEDQTLVTTPTTTFTLNRLETYLISSYDTTGMRVTSTKPISFFSNHRCTYVPTGRSACDFLTEQVPPTHTWGREFFVASLQGRTSGELFRVLAAHDSTVVRVKCTSSSQDGVYNLATAGSWQEFQIATNNFCSFESSAPILPMQFALGNSLDSVGDPFMMMIPPVEQYSNNYVLNVLSNFPSNYITIYVASRYYQPERIFVDRNNQRNAGWSAVRCVNNSICGYITRMSLPAGEHSLFHQDPEARVGVSAYGFDSHFNSYGYPGGLKLTPIQLATVSFETASYRISEQQDSLRVNITRSGNLQNTSVVLVASDDFQGNASAREDYTSVSEIVEFLPGQTERHIIVQINNDMRIEDNETFELYLIAGAGVNLTPLPRTEITIVNDDGMISLTPPYGSMLGGTGVVVTGDDLVVNQRDAIVCLFDGIEVRGIYINSQKVLCVSPLLERTGKLQFMLNISGSNRGESVFTSLTYTKCYGVYLDNDDLIFSNETLIHVRWSPFSIFPMELPNAYNVDIKLLELNLTTEMWSELPLATNISNIGYAGVSIPEVDESATLEGIISPIVISVSLSAGRGSSSLLTDLARLDLRPSQNTPVRYLGKSDSLVMQGLCTAWSLQQPTNIGQTILDVLPPCPLRQRDVVAINSGYALETFLSISPVTGEIPARVENLVCGPITSNTSNTVVDDKYKEYFHPNIMDCYRLRRTDLGGFSQQCCYNNAGFLATGPPGGGNVDRISPDIGTGLVRHFIEDVIPYLLCCKAEQFSKCNTFYGKRPSDRGFDFSPPRPPARARTDPHMVTFDGHPYTFNGKGEFVLVETPDETFSLQGRMLPITTAQNTESEATVYKAIVGKQNNSDTVQFEIIDDCGFIALVNGEQVIFGLINQQEFNNVVVSYLGNNTFSASFSSGAYVEAKEEVGIISVVSVSLPPSFEGNGTRGLMGSFNGNITDDLLPNSGQEPLSLNSSVREIHELFGITWIVDSPLDSLFTYRPGESWVTFYDPYFVPIYTPVFSTAALEQQANALCGDDTECLFDVAATGRVDIGEAAVESGRQFEDILELQIPIVCRSACVFGACVANDTCHCEPGYNGSVCSTPVYTSCDGNPCHFGGTCVQHGLDSICTCPPATSGDFCEIDLDIDECDLGVDQCHAVATCTNTRGSYFCTCPSGSSGDGFNCTDLCNECTGVPANCGTHNCNTTTSDCTNTIGSFQCTCRFGPTSDGLSCAPPPRPDPPTSVGITFVGTTTITITWVAPPLTNNISTYSLVLTESGGAPITVSVSSDSTSYNFTALEEYRTYSCILTAMSRYGPVSVATAPVSATTLQASPSAPPETPNAVAGSPTSATITWDPPPANDINGVIIQYIINVTVVGSGLAFQLSSTTTMLNITTLQPYTTYICIIAAVTSAGMGPFTSRITLLTPQAPPSSPPQSVQLSPVSSTSISLAWLPPPSSDINGVITEYRIIITEVLTGRVINLTSTTTSLTAAGLHPYYAYECIVSAFTVGNGPYSQTIRITTPEDVPSGSPLNFGGSATSSRSASISWQPPPDDQWNGVIIVYVINVTVVETGLTFQLNSTTTSLTVNTLQPYRNYICIVAAVTSVGTGPFSGRFTLTTPQDVPTGPPQNPSATVSHSRAILCSWNPPQFEHQNGRIVEYKINVTEVITGRVFVLVSTGTSLVIGSLHPDYVYRWVVTAVTVGVGPYTATSSIRTPEDVPTASPLSPGASALSSESVEITWQPPPLPDQNGVITGYVVNVTSLDSAVIQQITTPATNALQVSSLSPFTVYSCIIAARTAVGLGPYTTVITVRTLEAAPGSHPSNFTGESLNSTHIFLTWDTPPPSEINGIIREYRLNITEDITGLLFQYTTAATVQEITVGPLHPYYTYHCSVVAITVEAGPFTSIFAIQTEEDIPSGPPTNFVVTAVDPRTINLTWSPPNPEEQNGILRYYLVTLVSILPTETRNISSTQSSIVITGLRPYTAYNCTVSVGTVGLGPPTIISRVLTPEDAPTGPPQNFTVTINDSRSLILDWASPLPQEVNGIVTDYTVSVTSAIGNSSFQIGSNTTTYTLSSLRPFITYTCVIATHTSIGQGPFSTSISVTTPEDAPEAPPVAVTQSNVLSHSVVLSWVAPRSDRQNGVIRHYIIEAYENVTGSTLTYQTPSDQATLVVSNLHPFYAYTMRILAVTVSPGPLSAPIAVHTMEDIPTAAPLSPSGFALSPTLITVTWSPPPAEHTNGIIGNYLVEVTEVVTNNTWLFHATRTQINVGPLHPYYAYRCRVSASTIGPGPYTSFFYVNSGEAVPTGAPDNLAAAQATSSSLTLFWDPPPFDQQNGVIRYYILYIADVTNGTSLQLNANTTRVTIPNLQPFFTYNCTVAAFTVGRGPISTSLLITLPQAAPSVAPTNVRGFAPDHSSISLEWDALPTFSLNGILTVYVVTVTERETGYTFERNATTTSIILDSLHPHYVYECRVAAYTVELGPFSTVFAVQVLMAAPSGSPENVTTIAISSTSVEVTWDPPLPQHRNGPITSYNITVVEQQTGVRVLSLTLLNTSEMVALLRPFTTYSFVISAGNSVGYGPSQTVSRITPEDTPLAPTSVAASVVSGDPSSLYVSWDPPVFPNGYITHYNVYCQEYQLDAGSGSGMSVLPTSTYQPIFTRTVRGYDLNATVTGFTPFTSYGCLVSANTSVGEGTISNAVIQTTDEYIPVDPPLNLQVSVVNATSVHLTWSPPLIPYGIIVSYIILVEEGLAGGNVTTLVANSSLGTSNMVTNLLPYTYYNFSVAASTRIGTGPYDTVSTTTAQTSPYGSPISVAAMVNGTTTATLSWAPPDPNLQNGIITHYMVTVTDLMFGMPVRVYNTTYTTLSFTGLEQYTRYSCEVAAATVGGLGPFSVPVQFVTLQDVPSAPPQNISGSALSSTVIMLMWSPPPPLEINGDIQHYTVNAVERHTGVQWTFFVVDQTLHIGALHPYYYYDFNVSATTVGRGPFSATYSALTQSESPVAAPQHLTASKNSTSLTLSWNPPPFEDTNGLIQHYTILVTEMDTNSSFPPMDSFTTQITISNLHPYYVYRCMVSAYTVGFGPYSQPITVQLNQEAPTAAPLGLNGFARNSDSISLSWSPPATSERNGIIQHYLVNVTEVDTGSTYGHVSFRTNFTLFSLHPHYSYSIAVTAVTVSPGPPTAPVTIRTEQEVPSGPAQDLSVSVVSFEEVTISWAAPNETDRNGVITGYLINITLISTGQSFTRNATNTTHVLNGLQPFTSYTCSVAAMTRVGLGPISMPISFLTYETAPSQAPVNVSVAVVSSTSVELSWTPPPPASRNGIITEYRIREVEVDTGRQRDHVAFLTTIVVQSLHPYYTYHFSVSAHTLLTGPFSAVEVVQTPEDVPSGSPRSFMGRIDSSRSVTFSWLAPSVEEQSGMITSYTINITETGSGQTIQRTVPSSQTSVRVSTLLPFTMYSCSIAASTSVGTGPFSTFLTVNTPEDVPDMYPSNLTGLAQDSATITLSWDQPAGRHNGIIREYRLNITEVETGRMFQNVSATTNLVINSLHPDYTYEWRVTAFTVGEGPYSYSQRVTTFEDVPSGPPTNFNVSSLNSSSIFLSWSPPLPENQNGDITGYVINVTNLDNETVHQFRAGNVLDLAVTNLEPFTLYESEVFASTAVGVGQAPAIALVQTDEDAPESHPLNSSGYAINSTHIALNWSAPHEEDLNGILREYRINVTEGLTGTLQQHSTSPGTTEIVIGPLHPFYIYHCTIIAYTILGGPNTNIISVRTLEDAPSAPPTDVLASATSTRSIRMSWSPPIRDQQNGIIRLYVVTVTSVLGTVTRNVPSTQRTVTISGLRPYTVYNCTVQAETVRLGPTNDVIQVYTPEDIPTGPPQNVAAHAIDPFTLNISWAPPVAERLNGVIQRYSVTITEIDTGMSEQLSTTGESIVIPNRHPYYRYAYMVTAVTTGQGPHSVAALVRMPEAAPSSPPTGVQVTGVTATGFLVSWTMPPAVDHNGIIRTYSVSVTEENTGRRILLTSHTSSGQRVDSLHPYYNYTCVVAAVTVNAGPYSTPVTITTAEAVPSGPPVSFATVPTSSTSIVLTWDPPLLGERNGVITSYTITLNLDGSDTVVTTGDTMFTVLNLRPFTSYTFSVSASTRIGSGPVSGEITETTLEDAPAGAPVSVSSSNVTSTSVTLMWLPPLDPNGLIRHYIIMVLEINTGANFTYQAHTHASFSVGDLHPSYSYLLNVFAVTVEVGPPSIGHTVTTLEDIPSAAPVNIAESAVDARSLHITWNPPPAESRNGMITEYVVSISAQETAEQFEQSTTGDMSSLVIGGLHPDYTYSYTVAAGTGIGRGPFSTFRSIKMPEDVPTGAPLNVSGSAINSTAIIVNWELPALDGRNGIITGYSLIIREVPTNTVTTSSQRGVHIELVVASLHPYYEYECQIAAETAVGRGPYGDTVITRTLPDVPSGTPVDVRVAAVTSRSIRVVWGPPPTDQQNGLILHYVVVVVAAQTRSTITLNVSSNSTSIPDLHPSYSYSIEVAAVTVSVGPFSRSVSFTTPDDAPSGPPVGVSAVSVSSTSIRISWQAPVLELQNGNITSYRINILEIETGQLLAFTTVPTDSIYVVNNLHPFYYYNCSVAAFTNGLGPSTHSVVQTLPEEPSRPPNNVIVNAISATAVAVSWAPPNHEDRNGVIQSYTVRVIGIHTDDDFTISTNSTEITVDNLHPFYSYMFAAAAATTSPGPFSTLITVAMPSLAPQSAVRNVTGEALSPTSVRVRWLPGSQDMWNGIITQYTIQYSFLRQISVNEHAASMYPTLVTHVPSSQLMNDPDPTLAESPLVWEEIEIERLEAYSAYSFSIYYENSAGQSATSDILELSLPYSVPTGPPTDVSLMVLSQNAVLIRWNLPQVLERNGPIVGYEIVVNYTNGNSKVYTSPSGDVLSLQIEGLLSFVNKSITVAARTPAGVGPASAPIAVHATSNDILRAPTSVQFEIVGKTNVNLVWSHSNDPNGILLNYQVIYYGYRQDEPDQVTKRSHGIAILDGPYSVTVPPVTSTYLIKNLQTGLTYSIIVQARTATGYEVNSTEIAVDIPEELVVVDTVESGSTGTTIIVIAVVGWIFLMVVVVMVVAAAIWRWKFSGRYSVGAKNIRSSPIGIENKTFSEKEMDDVAQNEERNEHDFDKKGFEDDGNEMSFL